MKDDDIQARARAVCNKLNLPDNGIAFFVISDALFDISKECRMTHVSVKSLGECDKCGKSVMLASFGEQA